MSHNEICSLYGFILISIFFVFYSIKKGKKILIYIKSIKKQRYLPLTIQDLTHNHIQSEAEFWKLLTSLLQANGEIHPIINEKSYDITMNTYITFFHKTKTEFDKGYKKIFSSQL